MDFCAFRKLTTVGFTEKKEGKKTWGKGRVIN